MASNPTDAERQSVGGLFDRLAVLFGARAAQEEARRYVDYLIRPRDTASEASTRRRTSPMSARARRETVEQASWSPEAVMGPLQTIISDQIGTADAAFVLTERVFPRPAGHITGAASQYSPSHGGLVSAQVGLFLAYVGDRGRALADGRLFLPSGCSINEEDAQSSRLEIGKSKVELALDMLDRAAPHLPVRWVIAGPGLGSDARFRAEMRQRGFGCLVEVNPATEVFCHETVPPVGTRRRRRATSPAEGALLRRVTDLELPTAADSRAGRPVWESVGGAAGELLWLHAVPAGDASGNRFFLSTTDGLTTDEVAAVVTSRLDSPHPELSLEPGQSVLDDYVALTAAGWQRHMTLAFVVAAFRDQPDALTDAIPLPANGRDLAKANTHGLAVSSAIREAVRTRPMDELARPSKLDLSDTRKRLGLVAALLGVLMIGAVIVMAAIIRGIPSPGMRDLIRVSMFYHPPEDGTPVRALVNQVSHVIFTRGDERYFQQMRDAGFKGPALQYLVANETSGPENLLSASGRCGSYLETGNDVTGIGRDFCESLHSDERNFLHNGKGERLYTTSSYKEGNATRTRYYYLMNPGAQGWRDYFARRARENVADLPYGGLFLDNVDITRRRGLENETNSDKVIREYANDRDYREAVLGYLSQMRGTLGQTPMWANLTEGELDPDEYRPYLQYLDGVMNEYFITQQRGETVGPNRWQAQLAQAESVISQGKSFLAVAQGSRGDTNRMRFALASYLMIAGPNTYFRYADGEAYEQVWTFGDYENRVGSPLGRRYQVGDQWRRDFTCGYVTVDVERRAGEITINGSSPQCLVERLLVRFGA